MVFFEKKIYFHNTNLEKNHTYNTKHTIYKKKEKRAEKRLEVFLNKELFIYKNKNKYCGI